MALVAPDGSLGDAARPTNIIYKQGDGNFAIHDWFYEATAAGIVMQIRDTSYKPRHERDRILSAKNGTGM